MKKQNFIFMCQGRIIRAYGTKKELKKYKQKIIDLCNTLEPTQGFKGDILGGNLTITGDLNEKIIRKNYIK